MRLNKRTIAVSTASLLVAGGLSAYAYVSAAGAGSGSAGAAAADSVQNVVLTASLKSPVEPNGSENIVVKAHNPNKYTVKLASITITPNFAGLAVGCSSADFTVTSPTDTNMAVAPGDSTLVFTAPGKVSLADNTTDQCLGQTVALTVS